MHYVELNREYGVKLLISEIFGQGSYTVTAMPVSVALDAYYELGSWGAKLLHIGVC